MATRNKYRRIGVNEVLAIAVLCVSFVSAGAVFAQLPTATILGVVKDSTGAVIPGATLTAHNLETGMVRTAVSESNGSYRFTALPVGPYELRLEHPGFQTQLRSGLTLTVSQEAVVNFALEVGAIEQTVSVTADAPLVNTTSGSLGGLVDEHRVADLPLNGRNYIDLTLMQTGVQESKSVSKSSGQVGTWFSSNGAPLRSNNYLLDGAMMSNLYGGSSSSVSGQTLGVEGIREYRVVTNFFPAEYGMLMGSQMTIVSKNGTNDFHGSVFEYLRNSALDARNFFDYKTAVTPRRLPAFSRNNFGASVGGPIQKDKTFFYSTYEGVRERLGTTTITSTLPPEAKVDGGVVPLISPAIKPFLPLFPSPNLPNNQFTFPFTQPTREDFGQLRTDRTFSTDDSAFLRYTISDAQQVKNGAFPDFPTTALTRNQFATLSESHIFSASLLSTSRLSFSRTNWIQLPFTPPQLNAPQFIFVPGDEMGTIRISGIGTLGAASTSPRQNKQNILTLSEDVFITKGRSSWKFGTLINSFRQYEKQTFQRGGDAQFANIRSFLLGQPTVISQRKPGSLVDKTFRFYTLGFYIQNDLKASAKLTFNIGLRYEFQTDMNEVHGNSSALRDVVHDADVTLGLAVQNPTRKNVSPRFGFAWDARGNGKTAVRGGFGLLYDIGNISAALLGTLSGTPPFGALSTLSNPVFSVPFQIPDIASGRSLRIIDYHMQQMHLLQYNLSVAQQLPWNTAMTLAYAGSRGINLMHLGEGNPTLPQILPDGRQFWTGNDPRLNPNWNDVDFKTASSNSFYNSFQFGLTKNLSHGLQFQSSLTWAKIIDETQGQNDGDNGGAGGNIGQDPMHRSVDRALADFDVPLNWRFNTIYRLPNLLTPGSFAAKILDGWAISSIVSVQPGQPLTPALGSSRSRAKTYRNGVSGVDRPNWVGGRSFSDVTQGSSIGCRNIAAGTPVGNPTRWFDPCAFALQTAGFLGNAGRNIIRNPGLATMDISLRKEAPLGFLGESGRLEFRAELFNILNKVNLGVPSRIVYAGRADGEAPLDTAGNVTDAGAARQIQLALKIIF